MISLSLALLSSLATTIATAAPIPAKIEPTSGHRRLYVGPARPALFADWLAGMRLERKKIRAGLKKELEVPSAYEQEKLRWTKTNFVQAKVMAHERKFFDPATGKYTVDKYLDDLETRYGGVDSVLLWPAYPNIGVDNRNQFDLLRDMPGGYAGLKGAVNDFHRRGVRVLLPLNPWDNGTRSEGKSFEEAMVDALEATGADGIFGDTMTAPDQAIWEAGLKRGQHYAIEPESGLGEPGDGLVSLYWCTMSWGFMKEYQPIPGVDRFKWIEPRHMVHVTLREAQDHTDELQYAWFNGTGFNAWENVFGVWNSMQARDSLALRKISLIYRAAAKIDENQLAGDSWEPHFPVSQAGVFASRFPGEKAELFTIINRTKKSKAGVQLKLKHEAGARYFDLWNGVELAPKIQNGEAELSFNLEAAGFGAVYVSKNETALASIPALLAKLKALPPLGERAATWKPLPQTMVSNGKAVQKNQPPGMALIPAAKFNFHSEGLILEDYAGAGVQYPWEEAPGMDHDRVIDIPAFYLDKTLVTNEQFAAFVRTGYAPADSHNFWQNRTNPKTPATWVAIEDARAFCAANGKRLPNDWEWQYAAQGPQGKRPFPWGNSWNQKHVPKTDLTRTPRAPDAVAQFAASPDFGLFDMTGLVWQYTNEFHDEHNRRALLRGGSYYRPQTSNWYFPHSEEGRDPPSGGDEDEWEQKVKYFPNKLHEHGNYLLMAPSLDRSSTIGFRCAADL